MSQSLFVIAAGAIAGAIFCGSHALMLWWYRRKARLRFYRMEQIFQRRARPWWVEDQEGE